MDFNAATIFSAVQAFKKTCEPYRLDKSEKKQPNSNFSNAHTA
jgi:hypothetical protein